MPRNRSKYIWWGLAVSLTVGLSAVGIAASEGGNPRDAHRGRATSEPSTPEVSGASDSIPLPPKWSEETAQENLEWELEYNLVPIGRVDEPGVGGYVPRDKYYTEEFPLPVFDPQDPTTQIGWYVQYLGVVDEETAFDPNFDLEREYVARYGEDSWMRLEQVLERKVIADAG